MSQISEIKTEVNNLVVLIESGFENNNSMAKSGQANLAAMLETLR